MSGEMLQDTTNNIGSEGYSIQTRISQETASFGVLTNKLVGGKERVGKGKLG